MLLLSHRSRAQVVANDAEAIAAGIDFAPICNPTRFHVDTAHRYVAASIPVLVEKPISDQCDDAKQLVEDSFRHGTPGCMAYCMRYHPAYAAARQALRAGAIGHVLYTKAWFESYMPLWHPWEDYCAVVCGPQDLGGGACARLIIEIDFLNWCLGTPRNPSWGAVGEAGRCAATPTMLPCCCSTIRPADSRNREPFDVPPRPFAV